MKAFLFGMLFVCSAVGIQAQDVAAAASDTTAAPVVREHILFEGVEVKGDIYEFSAAMQKRGFTLARRVGNENMFIFKGPVCGQTCYVQASYTRHTRTVYRLLAQPKHVDLNVYLDSLQTRYGPTYDETDRGYQWRLPNGGVLFVTPEGYDPTLVVMDALGVVAYKDENDRPRMR